MDFEIPHWVEKIIRPKQESLNQIHDTLVEGFMTVLKSQSVETHDENVIDSLQAGDVRASIDERRRGRELGFLVAAMKQIEISVRRFVLFPATKRILFHRIIDEPESLQILEKLTEAQRTMLANTLTLDFCETWKRISHREAERRKAAAEEGREKMPQGPSAKKASRMATRVAAKDLTKVYKHIAGIQ